MGKVPGVIDKHNEGNPDSYYATVESVEKSIEDLKKVREEFSKAQNEEGVRKIDGLIAEFKGTRENVEMRESLRNPGFKSSLKQKFLDLWKWMKRKATLTTGLKALLVLAVYCFGISTVLSWGMWIFSYFPKLTMAGLGIYVGKKLL